MMRMPASTFRRVVARILDSLMISLIGFLIFGNPFDEWANGWVENVIYTVYMTITPVLWSGYVIGKRICKIKIKRYEDDGEVKLSNMILREVVGFQMLGFITFGISPIISLFMMAFREDKRGLHDLIGGTYVREK
ncbi:RDD family protein [Bacillus sp. AGMB 02131]|uniref:RDD family protein n=1 Tax=Peribacillus faecalis TaxID=2772559 RepID=A0A927HCE4_9BACI|nr:RDD family protein [Peribacillus faecalis]MBD3109944.1 RDD family protein [Peribacillus faecalis]